MYILYSNYYIIFIILFTLFSRYQALESNVEKFDGTSIDLIQNDLFSKSFIDQNSFVHSISGISENKYLRKRQIENKGVQREQKSLLSEKNNNEVKVFKRQAGRTPGKRFPGLRPPYPRQPNRRPPARRTTSRRLPNVKPITRKPGPRPTLPKRTTKKQTTSKRPPPRPSVRPPSRPQTPIPTTTKRATTTTRRTTTTAKFDKYAEFKSELISDINLLRQDYQAPRLNVSTYLTKKAQKYADESVKENKRKIVIKSQSFGALTYFNESIHQYSAINEWIKGHDDFDYNNLEKTVSRNFSQLVWYSSTKIGCGFSEQSKNRNVVIICLISPKGNVQGKFKENIRFPLIKNKNV
uniref:SCP domain-containing protein n=1 Tax=Strongyloides papillosus TaxID=174720 RepID=A0A0N5BL47_STREA